MDTNKKVYYISMVATNYYYKTYSENALHYKCQTPRGGPLVFDVSSAEQFHNKNIEFLSAQGLKTYTERKKMQLQKTSFFW